MNYGCEWCSKITDTPVSFPGMRGHFCCSACANECAIDAQAERTPVRHYFLDGAPLDLTDFVSANPDLAPEYVARILALQTGESVIIGGGAAASFVVTRDDEPCAPYFHAFGFRAIGTGGGHTGFSRIIGNVQTLVTSDEFDGFAPESMTEPVVVGEYVGDELDTQTGAVTYPSARAYLETLS